MKYITKIIISDIDFVIYKISRFYINAKRLRYYNSYGWDEVRKDIILAQQDKQLIPTNKTINEWKRSGFNVARNKRNWAFAYTIEGNTMYIHDAENCKNLKVDYQNAEQFTIGIVNKNNNKYIPMRYKISASRLEDGYIYLFKDGKRLPNYRFNEIIKPFYKHKNGEIYAIGLYGSKKYKITLDGVANALMEVIQKEIIHRIITETIYRKIKLLAS